MSLIWGMTPEILKQQIEAFAKAKNIAPATVTSRAVGNSRLFRRLENGGGCGLGTAQRLMAYMAENGSHQSSPSSSPENAEGV